MENPKNPKTFHPSSSSSSSSSSSQSQSTQTQTTRDIPTEIITDILKLLPPKPLLRFKAVSKPWKTLISSSDFTHLHFNQSLKSNLNNLLIISSFRDVKNRLSLFDLDNCTRLKTLTLDPEINPKYQIKVLCSCNGILLLSNEVLFNPLTRSFHKISPRFSNNYTGNNPFYARIRFIGFGYDSISHDYKIVLSAPEDGCNIFSLKENSWKKGPILRITHSSSSSGNSSVNLSPKQMSGKFVNNALHWVDQMREFVVAFELFHETFGLLALPDVVKQSDCVLGLSVLSCELLCLQVGQPGLDNDLDVWVMKEYGMKDSWTKLNRFKLLHDVVGGVGWGIKVLGYLKGGKQVIVETSLGYFRVENDGERRKVVKLGDHGVPRCLGAHVCVGSLILP